MKTELQENAGFETVNRAKFWLKKSECLHISCILHGSKSDPLLYSIMLLSE